MPVALLPGHPCSADPDDTVESDLFGERTLHAVARMTQPAFDLRPGAAARADAPGVQPASPRLEYRLRGVYGGFDVVLVDGASGIEGAIRAVAMGATLLLAVATPEPTALTDAYARIGLAQLEAPGLPVDLLVNRCEVPEDGRAADDRLALACERFLGRGVRYLGAVPEDRAIRAAVREPARFFDLTEPGAAAQSLRDELVDRMELPDSKRSNR